MTDAEFYGAFIGLAAMVVGAGVAGIIGCAIDRYIATPILRRFSRNG